MKVKTITNYHDRSEEALFDILTFAPKEGFIYKGFHLLKLFL